MKSRISYFLILVSITIFSCEMMDTTPDPDTVLISPLKHLNADQLAKHTAGDALFNKSYTVEDGVGPVFVATTCRSCHFNGGKGHPFNEIVRFGKWEAHGEFGEMLEMSGPQLQYRAIEGYPAEEVPAEADGVVKLNPPALPGLGLLEAITDADIFAWQDINDIDQDGITGRVPLVDPPAYAEDQFIFNNIYVSDDGKCVGRFGKKSFSANLFQQAARALNEDLGITTSAENKDPFNWKAPIALREYGDGVADPELPDDQLQELTYFLRSTAPPPRRDLDNPDVIEGETIFKEIGCVKCHRDEFTTGESILPELSNITIHPYTDMLLHDMGPGLDDGYTEGDAETYEWRTPPLWGLGLAEESQGGTGYYLHDGRATTLNEAIQAHGGEAESIKGNYNALVKEDQDKLIAFLRSL